MLEVRAELRGRGWDRAWPASAGGGVAARVGGPKSALAEYEELAKKGTTTGQIWRAAIERLIDAPPALLQRTREAAAEPVSI